MTISKIQHPSLKRKATPKKVSWTVFEKKYLTREDKWKYEWVDGIIEKTKRTMYPYQHIILFNLRNLFTNLIIDKKVSGSFESELNIFLSEKIHRIPDISYFNLEQVALMAYGELPIPDFVIEVVSTNDVLPIQNRKMKNYRDVGIKVIWQIFPETEEVQITRGKESILCTGDDICSAAPVLPNFKIAVKDIFKKPAKPKNLA